MPLPCFLNEKIRNNDFYFRNEAVRRIYEVLEAKFGKNARDNFTH